VRLKSGVSIASGYRERNIPNQTRRLLGGIALAPNVDGSDILSNLRAPKTIHGVLLLDLRGTDT
jgi:hypothetical protein